MGGCARILRGRQCWKEATASAWRLAQGSEFCPSPSHTTATRDPGRPEARQGPHRVTNTLSFSVGTLGRCSKACKRQDLGAVDVAQWLTSTQEFQILPQMWQYKSQRCFPRACESSYERAGGVGEGAASRRSSALWPGSGILRTGVESKGFYSTDGKTEEAETGLAGTCMPIYAFFKIEIVRGAKGKRAGRALLGSQSVPWSAS